MFPELERLFDVPDLERLLEGFHATTGITAAIISLDVKEGIGFRWQEICTRFHRRNPQSRKICLLNSSRICDDLLGAAELRVSECPHGLAHAIAPVVINSLHVANLYAGQFLTRQPDTEMIRRFEKQAAAWDLDTAEYLEALHAVPVAAPQQITSALKFLKHAIELIGAQGINRLSANQLDEAVRNANAELEKAVRRRKDEAQKLTSILEGNGIPTFVIDSEHRVTHWNRACELLTGLPAVEMIGTDRHREAFYFDRRSVMADFVVDRSGLAALRTLYGKKVRQSQFIKGGYEGEDFFPKLGPNGRWLFFTAAPLRDSIGTVIGAVETLQDVTDRHMVEQQLRDSASRYRQLFESANDAIFLLHEGAIADCNPKALELFECHRSAIIGCTPLQLSPEIQPTGKRSDEEIRKKTESLLQNIPNFFEWRFVKTNGRHFDAEVSITRFLISDTPYALAIVRDISDRKELIRKLEKRQGELDEKTRYLEKVNLALKNTLDHREVEKRAIEENILVNLKRFVFPYMEKLESCKISPDAKAYLNILQTNLNEVTSQFSETIFAKYVDLTPTEIRIADFIRNGKDSKEIANILGLSPSSVQWHRKNIRNKLKLKHKKVNLYTYLNSLRK